jgi:probable biosynthetic protein (TIGR04098 family)
MRTFAEYVFLKASRGATSRLRLAIYRLLGMKLGLRNRIEGGGRVRRCSQIEIGSYNAFTQGAWLWPNDVDYDGIRIRIGDRNYFNRNVIIDASGLISIGSHNMIGPSTFITDSNHTMESGKWVGECSMDVGRVVLGDGCWIGANVAILKDVTLGDRCVVAAGSVVTRSFPSGSTLGGNPARLITRHLANSSVAPGMVGSLESCVKGPGRDGAERMPESDQLREIVAALTHRPAADVQLDSWATQCGLDSLSLLILREQCEQSFGVSISDEDWAGMQSLNDVLTVICAPQRGMSASLRKNLTAASSTKWANIRLSRDSLMESVEIGMPLTGINQLSENALLKYLGDLRWRHVALLSGVPSRELADSSSNRLYPTFFYVELSFPFDKPMAYYGENDVLRVIDSVGRYGSSMLDGIAYLIPAEKQDHIGQPPDGLAQAKALGIPAVRMSNIFAMQFNGAGWLKKGRPKDGLIDGIRELPVAPDSQAIAKQAETNGYIELPGTTCLPLHDAPVDYEYLIQPDRDVNGVGLLYFANYPLFFDLAEREALKRARWPWPDDIINKRSIVGRKIAYLNNASWGDTLRIKTQVWIENPLSERENGLLAGTVRIFSSQQMYRASDDRLMSVCSCHKLLCGVPADQIKRRGVGNQTMFGPGLGVDLGG